jgi:hypothetical protein
MNIEDADNPEELWTAALEMAVKNGDQYILMPRSAMSEDKAVALAKRLDISVMVQGDDYAFTTTKQATQALLKKVGLDDDGETH